MKRCLIGLLLVIPPGGCIHRGRSVVTDVRVTDKDKAIGYIDSSLKDRNNKHYFDLNGDGKPEVIHTYAQSCGTGGCSFEIRDGASGRVLGEIFGSPVYVFARRVKGWPTIGAYSHSSAGSGTFSVYVYDGEHFKVESSTPLEGCDPIADFLAQFKDTPQIPWSPERLP